MCVWHIAFECIIATEMSTVVRTVNIISVHAKRHTKDYDVTLKRFRVTSDAVEKLHIRITYS